MTLTTCLLLLQLLCVNQVFTVYVVKVTSGISGRYWIIERRYSDFRQLHDTIRRKVGRPPLHLLTVIID